MGNSKIGHCKVILLILMFFYFEYNLTIKQ